jgi:hypothetical protein
MHYDQRNRISLTRALYGNVYGRYGSIKVGPKMDLLKFRANSFDGFLIDSLL